MVYNIIRRTKFRGNGMITIKIIDEEKKEDINIKNEPL